MLSPSRLFPLALAPLLGAETAPGTFPQTDAAKHAKAYDEAVASGRWDLAVRALVLRLRDTESVKDEGEGDFLRSLDQAVATAPEKTRPVLRALTAKAYCAYYDRHRWELRNRTAGGSGDKIEGRDGPRLLKETDARLQAALADEPFLAAVPIGDFAGVTDKGRENPGDVARPTLFDFIAYDAFAYYTDASRFDIRPEETPVAGRLSPVFGDTATFLAGRDPGDTPAARASTLLRRLLTLHAKTPEAFAEAELTRLRWATRLAASDETRLLLRSRFAILAEDRPGTLAAPAALAEQAVLLLDAGETVAARDIASRGAKLRPGSPGAVACANLVRHIEAPSLRIDNERVWSTPAPRIVVRHRNLDRLRFRLVKWDWKQFLGREHGRPEAPNAAEIAGILAAAPAKSWEAALPKSDDFQETETRLRAPDDVPPGFYFLVASVDDDFSGKTAPVFCTDVWVSNLAVVAEGAPGEVRGLVCDARTGEPVAGATVSGWVLQNNRDRVPTHDAATGADGRFAIQVPRQRGVLLLARNADGDAVASMNEIWTQPAERTPVAKNNVSFFTDRGIYRPGQTLKFKGAVYRDDPVGLKPHLLTGRKVTVVLDDANGKEIARTHVVTNGYGGFDGEFVIPKDRLPGAYALHTTGNENGRAYPQVEEYKRPTFEVTLAAATGADRERPLARTVRGTATNYTGAPADGAKVVWRITRHTDIPFWFRWWRPEPDREIARGETKTGADGAFAVTFDAEQPPKSGNGAAILYRYTVIADVVDSADETRSASRTVVLGDVDRMASIATSAPGAFEVAVRDLDGETGIAAATGKVVIRKLVEPRVVHRRKPDQGHFVQPYRNRRQTTVIAEPAPVVESEDEDVGELADPANWQPGDIVATLPFTTDKDGKAQVAAMLPPGHYRAFVETTDSAGRPVVNRTEARVLPESGDKLGLKVPFVAEHVGAKDYAPGDTAIVRWGSGYDTARAYVEIGRRGKPVERFWTGPGKTLTDIKIPVSEADRGGIGVSVTAIHDNRLYRETFPIAVPWSDKALTITWDHFTDKLKPGAKETWTAKIAGPDGKPAEADIVATLYDASLDAYRPLDWPGDFDVWPDFRGRSSFRGYGDFFNVSRTLNTARGEWVVTNEALPDVTRGWESGLSFASGIGFGKGGGKNFSVMMISGLMASRAAASSEGRARMKSDGHLEMADAAATPAPGARASVAPAFGAISPRKNLNETAFFLPRAHAGDDGRATFAFTVPEALTRWRLLAFAYDKGLRTGRIEASAVTSLDLMVRPNAPRFLREGDVVELPVKVLNRTDKPVAGVARLDFENAVDHTDLDTALKNTAQDKTFEIPANGSVALAWRVTIPDGCGPLAYTVKASAASGDSDGEAGLVPVLPRRVPVVESKAASLTGPGETTVRLANLAASAGSDTLRSTQLRVDTVSRPAWYAVMALPYLMEYPHECSEQLFHRYYADALAAHIANADPKLRGVFDTWKNTPALDSPLEKNDDLKQIALEETPWVREAASEAAQRRRVGLLFDKDRLADEIRRTLDKLESQRAADGGWPWFPGGESSPWIARTVTLGIGRLRAMGVAVEPAIALKALPVLDADIARRYADILKAYKDKTTYRLDADLAHTLHARAYFLADAPVPDDAKEAYAFFTQHAASDWSWLDRASQARLALALPAFGDNATPALVVKSLRERAVATGDTGMRWNEARAAGFAWWRPWVAPIETQALMVEVFETIAKDPAAADACRLALLADKRTNAWPTTTATADACYALLMRGGADWLSGEGACEVSVAGKTLTPEAVEAGTGAATVRVPVVDITPKAADIRVKKPDPGPAWIAVHWSYLEDPAKVKPANQGAITVVKTLWKKTATPDGPKLVAITAGAPVRVGDEVVVRLEVTNDRALEFVHIKDTRPACLEPGIAVSGYRWTSDVGYYEAVRDTATHRFVESLPKGTHVFEFTARADRRGVCGAGLSEVRCLYAPEFEAHAGAGAITVE